MESVSAHLDFFRIRVHETTFLVVKLGILAHDPDILLPVLDRIILVLLGLVLMAVGASALRLHAEKQTTGPRSTHSNLLETDGRLDKEVIIRIVLLARERHEKVCNLSRWRSGDREISSISSSVS